MDEKIDKYAKLLGGIEETLKTLEGKKNEQVVHLVKVYEAMSADEAAARLSALDQNTAVQIILKMKSKKAGLILSSMEPKNAAFITESIFTIVKKIPAR